MNLPQPARWCITQIPLLQQFWQQRWHLESCLPIQQRRACPAWLVDPSSTTAKMRQACQDFRVEILANGWQRAHCSETLVLNSAYQRQSAWVREVALWCDGVCWMYGRTLVPVAGLQGATRRLQKIGTKSLGEVLAKDPHKQRSLFEIAAPCPQWPDYYARRSVFWWAQQPLLLTEIFCPPMVEYLS